MSFSGYKPLPHDFQLTSGRMIRQGEGVYAPRGPVEHSLMKVLAHYDEAVKCWLNLPLSPVLSRDKHERYVPSQEMRALVTFSKEWGAFFRYLYPNGLPDRLGEPPPDRYLSLKEAEVRMHPYLELFLPMAHYLRSYQNARMLRGMHIGTESSERLQDEVMHYMQQVKALTRRPSPVKGTSTATGFEPWWMAVERYQKRFRDNKTSTRAIWQRVKRHCKKEKDAEYVVMCVYVGGTPPTHVIPFYSRLMWPQLKELRKQFSTLLKKTQKDVPVLEYVWSLLYLPQFGFHYRLMLILPKSWDDTQLQTLVNYLRQKWATVRPGRSFISNLYFGHEVGKFWWREPVTSKEGQMVKTLDSWLLLDQLLHIERPLEAEAKEGEDKMTRPRLRTFGTSHGPRPQKTKNKKTHLKSTQ